MTCPDSLGAWLTASIHGLLQRPGASATLLLWCDPSSEWLALLQAVASAISVELWADPKEDEFSTRDRYFSAPKKPRIVWLPRSRKDLSWFKVFELEADAVWEKSLLEALREYGVDIPRDQEQELSGLLPAHALEWLEQPKGTWKELTPGIAKGTLVSDRRVLEVLAEEAGEFERLRAEERFGVFCRRAIEDFGLPDPSALEERVWRVAATASLLATEAAAANPQNPPSEADRVIPPGRGRDNALSLLRSWQSNVDFISSFETVSREADKQLGLSFWARNLASPPRSYSSRSVEEACFQAVAGRLDRVEEIEQLCSELEKTQQEFLQRANGFWEKRASQKVGWRYLVQLSQAAGSFLESDKVETHWQSVADGLSWYAEKGWRIDTNGEELYMEHPDFPDVLLRVRARIRRAYQRRVDAVGRAFSSLLAENGQALSSYPFAGEVVLELLAQSKGPVAIILLDACSLQYGRRLAELLNEGEPVERAQVRWAVAPVPTITGLGKAFALPLRREELRVDIPRDSASFCITAEGFPGNLAVAQERRQWLTARLGIRSFYSIPEVIDGSRLERPGKARKPIFVEGEEFDAEGHEGRLKLTGAEEHIARYAQAVRKLRAAGYTHVIVTTDHGFFHWQSDPQEVEDEKPEGDILIAGRRAMVGRGLQHKSAVRLPVPCSGLEALVPRSVNAFKTYGGMGYFHGGATMQELVIPVLSASWPQKARKIPAVLKPVEHIASLAQQLEIAPGRSEWFEETDENLLPRFVEVKIIDPGTGALIFRSDSPGVVTPGGESVFLSLRQVPEAKARYGKNLELRLVDADSEEILERKTVTLKIELDEWT